MQIEQSQFSALLLSSNPWIDLRAPTEFLLGSIPNAVNLPLLKDHERAEIGLIYKKSGQQAAIARGHELVSGAPRERRLDAWEVQIRNNPKTIIFCFRGGLRSQIVQAWLLERGLRVPLVLGGYKAIRRFLLETFEDGIRNLDFKIVCGPTGSGKTQHLRASGEAFIDFEALANHRGSAFGAFASPQPTQINFENSLALEVLKLSKLRTPVLVEDESRMIGRRSLPEALFEKMQLSPRIVIDLHLDDRVRNILRDYVLDVNLRSSSHEEMFENFRQSVLAISKRLGGLRAKEILDDLEFSVLEFRAGRGLESNCVWIRKLLIWYYDPLYQRSSISKKGAKVFLC